MEKNLSFWVWLGAAQKPKIPGEVQRKIVRQTAFQPWKLESESSKSQQALLLASKEFPFPLIARGGGGVCYQWRSAHSLCWHSGVVQRGLILAAIAKVFSQWPGSLLFLWGPLCRVPYFFQFNFLQHWMRRLGLFPTPSTFVQWEFTGACLLSWWSPFLSPHRFELLWRDCSLGIILGVLQLGSLLFPPHTPMHWAPICFWATSVCFSILIDHSLCCSLIVPQFALFKVVWRGSSVFSGLPPCTPPPWGAVCAESLGCYFPFPSTFPFQPSPLVLFNLVSGGIGVTLTASSTFKTPPPASIWRLILLPNTLGSYFFGGYLCLSFLSWMTLSLSIWNPPCSLFLCFWGLSLFFKPSSLQPASLGRLCAVTGVPSLYFHLSI